MSCEGTARGRPCAGDRMLRELSISTVASTCDSGESGMCTAIWSPSKSALNAVQENRMLADDVLENVPNDRLLLLDHLLGLLDGRAVTLSFELVIDEGLEELERHLFRQTALVELQLRTHDDDRAPGIVHALAEQVLAEAALFAL